jgi:hypothetical protein
MRLDLPAPAASERVQTNVRGWRSAGMAGNHDAAQERFEQRLRHNGEEEAVAGPATIDEKFTIRKYVPMPQ